MASYRELAGALEALLRLVSIGEATPHGTIYETCTRLVDEARRGRNTETPWTPFEESNARMPTGTTLIQSIAKLGGISEAEARRIMDDEADRTRLFVNSRYQVAVRQDGPLMHLSIKRIDQAPIHAWRDLQRIKDELVGVDCEAVEIYPAADRLVDTANQYHLWALADGERFPIGFNDGRLVSGQTASGARQEPFEGEAP